MQAITISRQLGSLGTQIAHQVAGRLGYCVVWREIINRAARDAGAPEMALAEIDDLGLLGIDPPPEECDAYHAAMRNVMQDLADRGRVIIIGRAGQVLLRDRPDVLHVKIMAPADIRAHRIAEVQGISAAAARAQIEASDSHRKDYLERCFGARWDDPTLYDVVVNTRRLTPLVAADLICQACKSRESNAASSATASGGAGID